LNRKKTFTGIFAIWSSALLKESRQIGTVQHFMTTSSTFLSWWPSLHIQVSSRRNVLSSWSKSSNWRCSLFQIWSIWKQIESWGKSS